MRERIDTKERGEKEKFQAARGRFSCKMGRTRNLHYMILGRHRFPASERPESSCGDQRKLHRRWALTKEE